MLSIYMAGMLQSEIAARHKQHILDTAGIDEVEAKLKSCCTILWSAAVEIAKPPPDSRSSGTVGYGFGSLMPAVLAVKTAWLYKAFLKDAGVDIVLENSLSAASLSTVHPAEASSS